MVHSVVGRAWWRAGAVLSAALVGAGATVALLGAPASAATVITGNTTVATIAHIGGPLGIAASGGDIYVTHPYGEVVTEYVTVLSARGTTSEAIPKFTVGEFCAAHTTFTCQFSSFTIEPYVAVAPGTATSKFPGGEVYITQGPNVYEMPAGGGAVSPFTTVPGMFTGVYRPCCNVPEYASGITFDTVGTYTHDMILTSPNGTVWKVTATGTATELATLGTHTPGGNNPATVIEGPAVAPRSFTPYGGDLLVAAENQDKVFALTAATGSAAFKPIATVTQAEGIEVIPASPCAVTVTVSGTRTPYSWFSSTFGTTTVSALPASAFAGLGTHVLVQSEHSGSTTTAQTPAVTLLTPEAGTTPFSAALFVQHMTQQEGATFEQCPGGTTGAKTIGYWRNRNGNAYLSSHTSFWPVTLGGTRFSISVTVLTESNAILSGTACSSFFTCNALAKGLHELTFEDLVAQTLALSYNVKASPTLQGTVFSGCNEEYITGTALTGLAGLSASSSVTEILDAANLLINTSKNGGTTTQAEAGAMTALLGECINTV